MDETQQENSDNRPPSPATRSSTPSPNSAPPASTSTPLTEKEQQELDAEKKKMAEALGFAWDPPVRR